MGVRLRRMALAAMVVAPALACQIIVGIDDDKFTFESQDAAIEADAEVEAAPDPCAHAIPPGRPPGNDHPVERTFTFALSRLDVTGRTATGELAGFDLDGTCTCLADDASAHGGARSCNAPSTASHPELCDGDAGIDNALAQLLDQFSGLGGAGGPNGSLAQSFNDESRCGSQGLLLVVTGYNGLKDDPRVLVFPLESGGLRDPHDGGEAEDSGCGELPEAGAVDPSYPAKYDGTDLWTYATGTLNETTRLPNRSPVAGWVKDFRLVVDGRDPKNPLTFPLIFGSMVVTVSTAALSARLVPLGADGGALAVKADGTIDTPDGGAVSFRMTEGVLGGRLASKDMLAIVGRSAVGVLGPRAYLCEQPALYEPVKGIVCDHVDTVSLPDNDFKQAPCDALSMAVQFEAVVAGFSRPFDVTPVDGGCGATFQDNCK